WSSDVCSSDLPADELGPAPEAAPGGRGRTARAVPDRVVAEPQRDAGGQQGHQVRQDERAAAVLVGDRGEAPDVAEPDGGADGRADDRGPAGEGAAIGARRDGAGGWGRCTHGGPPGNCAAGDGACRGPTTVTARGSVRREDGVDGGRRAATEDRRGGRSGLGVPMRD